jgi:hypothetical protein
MKVISGLHCKRFAWGSLVFTLYQYGNITVGETKYLFKVKLLWVGIKMNLGPIIPHFCCPARVTEKNILYNAIWFLFTLRNSADCKKNSRTCLIKSEYSGGITTVLVGGMLWITGKWIPWTSSWVYVNWRPCSSLIFYLVPSVSVLFIFPYIPILSLQPILSRHLIQIPVSPFRISILYPRSFKLETIMFL